MYSIFPKILVLFMFLNIFLNANEVKLYALQKYNLQYDEQLQETQTKIAQEYQNNLKLFKVLDEKQMKNNPQIKMIAQIATVQLWSNEFLKNYQPNEAELQELFKKKIPNFQSDIIFGQLKCNMNQVQ